MALVNTWECHGRFASKYPFWIYNQQITSSASFFVTLGHGHLVVIEQNNVRCTETFHVGVPDVGCSFLFFCKKTFLSSIGWWYSLQKYSNRSPTPNMAKCLSMMGFAIPSSWALIRLSSGTSSWEHYFNPYLKWNICLEWWGTSLLCESAPIVGTRVLIIPT